MERVAALRQREAERAGKTRQERPARSAPAPPPAAAAPASAPPSVTSPARAPQPAPAAPGPAATSKKPQPAAGAQEPAPRVPTDPALAARAAASAVQIQLGAFRSRAETEAAWARIYRANEDVLRGRALVLQSTISGGRRFFRLRVGPFRDRIEAQNVCRALQARGQDCLVAVNG